MWCRWPVNALVAVVASAAADGHGDELQEVGAWHWLVALALLYRMGVWAQCSSAVRHEPQQLGRPCCSSSTFVKGSCAGGTHLHVLQALLR